jgi:two-component system KDP operon response regulator KdpE
MSQVLRGLTASPKAAALALPDAVVLDLLLPDGTGVEVCRRLREWPRCRSSSCRLVDEETQTEPPRRGPRRPIP